MNIIYPFNLTFIDYPDNESCAVLLYMMGCDNSCIDCHNLKFKDYNFKENVKNYSNVNELINDLEMFLKRCDNDVEKNQLVLTGGDPLSSNNLLFTKELLNKLNNKYEVMIYTGKDVEYVKKNQINNFKFIKCGEYDNNLSQISEKNDQYLKFASRNQKLYDSRFTLLSNDGIYYFKRGDVNGK